MRMGGRRKMKDWYEDYNPGQARKSFKHQTIRQDRIEGQEEIREGLDDYEYGIDPD